MTKLALSRMVMREKLQHGDLQAWAAFNRSFVNVDFPVERIARAVIMGHAFSAQFTNNWRHSDNYLLGQHLGIDFDAGDSSSSIETLMRDKFISKYAAFVYSTMSSTPEAPRSRVVFLLDTPIHQATNYVLASSSLLWLYGSYGGADRACKDPCRGWFPSLGGRVEILGNTLPLDVVKHNIASYQQSGEAQKRTTTRRDYQAPAEMAEVADALRHIPATEISYDEWLSVLMGIHSEFGDAGLEMAEVWGEGKPGEIKTKWKSFKGGNVTIGSVFGLAKQYGWSKKHADL